MVKHYLIVIDFVFSMNFDEKGGHNLYIINKYHTGKITSINDNAKLWQRYMF